MCADHKLAGREQNGIKSSIFNMAVVSSRALTELQCIHGCPGKGLNQHGGMICHGTVFLTRNNYLTEQLFKLVKPRQLGSTMAEEVHDGKFKIRCVGRILLTHIVEF